MTIKLVIMKQYRRVLIVEHMVVDIYFCVMYLGGVIEDHDHAVAADMIMTIESQSPILVRHLRRNEMRRIMNAAI